MDARVKGRFDAIAQKITADEEKELTPDPPSTNVFGHNLLINEWFNTASKFVFVIMRIGSAGEKESDTDRFFREVIGPAAKEFDLEAKRVDFTDGPEMIAQRALALIDKACFVVCDLTHERPNCYFEGGYAFKKGIPCIWTAREDHDPRRHGRTVDNPKVHFDLDAFRMTYWSIENFEQAKKDLRERMQIALDGDKATAK